MDKAKRFFTVVYEVPHDWKPGADIMDNPMMTAVSWSHAIHDRDAYKESTRVALQDKVLLPNQVDDVSKLPCLCRKCIANKTDTNGWPLASTMFLACEKCGNKRCPHISDHTFACTNSNEPGQTGSVY